MIYVYIFMIKYFCHRNSNSLVGMSVSTASAASKTLNDLISQQQQVKITNFPLHLPYIHTDTFLFEWMTIFPRVCDVVIDSDWLINLW